MNTGNEHEQWTRVMNTGNEEIVNFYFGIW